MTLLRRSFAMWIVLADSTKTTLAHDLCRQGSACRAHVLRHLRRGRRRCLLMLRGGWQATCGRLLASFEPVLDPGLSSVLANCQLPSKPAHRACSESTLGVPVVLHVTVRALVAAYGSTHRLLTQIRHSNLRRARLGLVQSRAHLIDERPRKHPREHTGCHLTSSQRNFEFQLYLDQHVHLPPEAAQECLPQLEPLMSTLPADTPPLRLLWWTCVRHRRGTRVSE